MREQQRTLRDSLETIDRRLQTLEGRNGSVTLPPIPRDDAPEPVPADLPPLPPLPGLSAPALPPLPPLPPPRPARPSLEFRLAPWLLRLGGLLLLISLLLLDLYFHLHRFLGAWGKLGLLCAASLSLITWARKKEKRTALARKPALGRLLLAGGLTGLYLTIYAACQASGWRVVHTAWLAAVLLLGWASLTLLMAARRRRQALAWLAFLLVYLSVALAPLDKFSLGEVLFLTAAASLLLVRRGWVPLAFLALAGSYLALLLHLVVSTQGELILDTSRNLAFVPHALFLFLAWTLFTLPVVATPIPVTRSWWRLFLAAGNNFAFAGLLALTAFLSGYGFNAVGWSLLVPGLMLLLLSRLVPAGGPGAALPDLRRLHLAQGLFLATGGLLLLTGGVTRAWLLWLETLVLGTRASSSRSLTLAIGTGAVAFLAAFFSGWEVAVPVHQPWLLGLGGGAILLLNAWWNSRGRPANVGREEFRPFASYYTLLALGLWATTLTSELDDRLFAPALACSALALTFLIHRLPLLELPALAQLPLLAAQVLVLFPVDSGVALSPWSIGAVAAVTLLMMTWWSRQRRIPADAWSHLVNVLHALALVLLAYQAFRPHLHPQEWMVTASLLACAFLTYAAFTRVWLVGLMGQLFLIMALIPFLPASGGIGTYPWPIVLVPIVASFAIGHAILRWLELNPSLAAGSGAALRRAARVYQIVAAAGMLRAIMVLAPEATRMPLLLFLGTLLLAGAGWSRSSFGVRCSYAFSLLGALLLAIHFSPPARDLITVTSGLAVFTFLIQAPLLRRAPQPLVSAMETGLLVLASAATGWLFVSAWVIGRMNPNYLTLAWAAYAVFLFLLGLALRERRQRWGGLFILLAAIVRVFVADFWGFSHGYRVLTFIVLALITLGLGFVYTRFSHRLKMWL